MLVGLISPYRQDRDEVRKRHEQQGIPFYEVFLDVPVAELKNRDPKGQYANQQKRDKGSSQRIAAGANVCLPLVLPGSSRQPCVSNFLALLPSVRCPTKTRPRIEQEGGEQTKSKRIAQ
jgi:hypothetical protein